jgi:hypothetical protein
LTTATPSGWRRSSAIDRLLRLLLTKLAARVAGGAGEIAAPRRLDLDHVGALIGENHGAVRAGNDGAQVEDADAVQRSGHEGLRQGR